MSITENKTKFDGGSAFMETWGGTIIESWGGGREAWGGLKLSGSW